MAITLSTSDQAIPGAPFAGRLSTPQVWGIVLLAPYALVFLAFVIYPVGYGLWLARHPASYVALYNDPIFARAAVNTLVFLVIGINFKMLVALFLSGFFIQERSWIRWLSVLFILPWAVPSIPTILSVRFMFNPEWGMVNHLIFKLDRRGRPELAQRSHRRADDGDHDAHLEIAAVLDLDPDDRTAGDPGRPV